MSIIAKSAGPLRAAWRRLRGRRLLRRMRIVSGSAEPLPSDEIVLFSVVRNERHQLETFFEHYRGIDISRFYIVDNGSTDGTWEFLLRQPDVVLFETELPFGDILDSMNALIEKYAMGRWSVVSDADERLFYPGIESAGLRRLTRYLDTEKASALGCSWIDMYTDRPLSQAEIRPNPAIHEQFPYFDRYELIYAATRRVFKWNRYPRKVPLIKYNKKAFLRRGAHYAENLRHSRLQGAVLHFAFNDRLKERTAEAVVTGQYFNQSEKYRVFLQLLEKDDLNFFFEGSLKFEDSSQLTSLGFMTDQPAWREYRRS